jgi:cobalt/nickel transport protein
MDARMTCFKKFIKSCLTYLAKDTRSAVLTSVVLVLSPGTLQAHEVWIEPSPAQIAEGQDIVADLRIGDMFVGDHLIYLPQETEKLAIMTNAGAVPLRPRVGSRPVVDVDAETLNGASGHIMLIYQSDNSYIYYKSPDRFFRFAEKKGAVDVRQEHRRRQLPDSDFVERYKRFAKASMVVGPTFDQINDRIVGMEVEFLLQDMRPISDGRQRVDVQLLYQGDVLPDASVTLFVRDPDGMVTHRDMTTDADGMVSVMAAAGHDYLLDHVTLRSIDPNVDRNKPVWESLWASMTFSAPQIR